MSSWIRCFGKCTTLSNRNAFAKTINTVIKPAPFPSKKKRNVLFFWYEGYFYSSPHPGRSVSESDIRKPACLMMDSLNTELFCNEQPFHFTFMFSIDALRSRKPFAQVAWNSNTLNLCFASHLWIKYVLSES